MSLANTTTSWGSRRDYTLDLSYPSEFVFGQTPVHMQWAAAAAGAPMGPLVEPFSYCDLGCGDGVTLNVLAAEYPQASFTGVDLNAGHLERARALADRAGLGNVSYREASLADLDTIGLPQMDYIAVHGVYAWVDAPTRAAILEFVRSHLKPGGLVCVQYACLPSAVIHDPLCAYVRTFSARASGDSEERFRAGVATLREIMPFSRFFERNPQAAEIVERFGTDPPGQAAHDVLNRELHSFYFHEVHEALVSRGLEFMGSSNLKLNHPELMLTREAYAAYLRVVGNADRISGEETLDLLLNTSSRCDLFRRPDPEADRERRVPGLAGLGGLYLQRAPFSGDAAARQRASKSCAIDLASGLHTAVLDALQEGSMTIEALLSTPALSVFNRADAEQGIAQLFMMRYLNVLIRPALRLDYDEKRRYQLAEINSILLRERIAVPDAVAFASPVLGSALMIPPDQRLRLLAFLGGDLAPVWQQFQKEGRRVIDDRRRAVTSLEQFSAGLRASLPAFRADALPELLRLGVLEAAD